MLNHNIIVKARIHDQWKNTGILCDAMINDSTWLFKYMKIYELWKRLHFAIKKHYMILDVLLKIILSADT